MCWANRVPPKCPWLKVSAAVRAELVKRAAEFNIMIDDVALTHLSFGTEVGGADHEPLLPLPRACIPQKRLVPWARSPPIHAAQLRQLSISHSGPVHLAVHQGC
jgi:hypothetical protein